MTARTAPDHDLKDTPSIEQMLPDEPGDDRHGLLPVTALQRPVRMRFAPWENTLPSPQSPETVTMYRANGQPVASKVWTAPIEPDDYWLDIEMGNWPGGPEQLYYWLEIFNGAVGQSQRLDLYIDRQPPVLNGNLELPAQVLPPQALTARYLETHGDVLDVGMPRYTDARPGDTVVLFWDAELYDDTVIQRWRLTPNDLEGPLSLPLTGELVREQGEGTRYLHYQIIDRAGNRSADSRMLRLDVAAAPLPRSLPSPEVVQASGTGGSQVLLPADAKAGVTVTVPSEADIYPEEAVRLHWAVPGTVGAWTSPPLAGSQRLTFEVPNTSIGAHLGKQIEVYYEVATQEGAKASTACRLTVRPADSAFFTQLRCLQANGGDLSLGSVPSTGAQLALAPWPLISTDQQVRIDLAGTGIDGYPYLVTVLRPRAVTAIELTTGLGNIVVPKARLQGLQRYTPLTFEVYVSFDQGNTWPESPNFPLLRLTVQA